MWDSSKLVRSRRFELCAAVGPQSEPRSPRADWYEAVAYANELSERHEPRLTPCYDLIGCEGGFTHPVMRKRPNGWGLFDMLGNVEEWVHDSQSGSTPAGPLQDPGGTAAQHTTRLTRGGSFMGWSSVLRSAGGPSKFILTLFCSNLACGWCGR